MPDKNKDVKVLKGDELSMGSGFLSGLGFSSEEKKEEEKKDVVVEEKAESSLASVEDLSAASKTDDFSSFVKSQNSNIRRPASTNFNKSNNNKSNNRPNTNQSNRPRKQIQHGSLNRNQSYRPAQKKSVLKSEHEIKISENVVRKPKVAKTSENLVKKSSISMLDTISVKEFAEKMGVSHLEVMKKLLENKIMVSINSSIDFDTACLIASEFDVEVTKEQISLDVESFMLGDLQSILDLDKQASNKQMRPPIVTVMGHVDHGKTSLLDYLRKTNVAGGEAGGITQSIGASVIDYKGQKVTFIDTPGHELFTTLRARGAKLTNVAVIVIAADDGIMPQTAESIDHAKAAGVPIVVAVTKIDKPQNNFERIKTDLGKHDIIPEDRGGDVPVIGVSSHTGQGIDELLEAILLHSEMLELQYNPDRSAVGVVLDAYKDAKQGIVSSIIILTGTLKVGDILVAYNTYGKVKRMQDWKGNIIKRAKGGDPIQILGLSEMPDPGRMVEVVNKEKDAQERISLISSQGENDVNISSLDQFLQDLDGSEQTELRLVLKAEGSSSLDALNQAVESIATPDNVIIKIIRKDVGQFTDSDLALAQASKALLIGFDVAVNSSLKKKAAALQVDMKSFDIIYELTDYLSALTLGMIKKEYEEVNIGKMTVLGVFFRKGKEMVIGGKVDEGLINNGCGFRVLRKEGDEIIELAQGKVNSLQKDKNNVKTVASGHECGMKIKVGKKVEEGDVLEFYEEREKV